MSRNFDAIVQEAKRTMQELRFAINERLQLQKSNQDLTAIHNKIRRLNRQCSKALTDLKSELHSSSSKSNPATYAARQKAVASLENEFSQISTQNDLSNSANKAALLSNSSYTSYSSTDNRAQVEPKMSTDQLQLRTEEQIRAQDALLDNISAGLTNLQAINLNIQDEAQLHIRLLDDLSENVDESTVGLERESERAKHLIKDTRTCWLYVTILLLLIVLIVLVIYRWS